MASAIFFELRSTILATIQHNWQCISWLIIDSTKEFQVQIRTYFEAGWVHLGALIPTTRLTFVSVSGEGHFIVCCALIA